MNLRVFLLMVALLPASVPAQGPEAARNAFLANPNPGLLVSFRSLSHFSFPADPLFGIVAPVTSSLEAQVLGSYHDHVSIEPPFYRGFNVRALSLRVGITKYFHTDETTTPFIGSAIRASFYHKYHLFFAERAVLTLGNSTLSVHASAGIAWTPTAFFQLRGAYVLEYARERVGHYTADFIRQKMELGVVVKIPA